MATKVYDFITFCFARWVNEIVDHNGIYISDA